MESRPRLGEQSSQGNDTGKDTEEHEAHLGHLRLVVIHALIHGLLKIGTKGIKGSVLVWRRRRFRHASRSNGTNRQRSNQSTLILHQKGP